MTKKTKKAKKVKPAPDVPDAVLTWMEGRVDALRMRAARAATEGLYALAADYEAGAGHIAALVAEAMRLR